MVLRFRRTKQEDPVIKRLTKLKSDRETLDREFPPQEEVVADRDEDVISRVLQVLSDDGDDEVFLSEQQTPEVANTNWEHEDLTSPQNKTQQRVNPYVINESSKVVCPESLKSHKRFKKLIDKHGRIHLLDVLKLNEAERKAFILALPGWFMLENGSMSVWSSLEDKLLCVNGTKQALQYVLKYPHLYDGQKLF